MKNIKFLILLLLMPFLVSCTNIISNPDIQTLNNRAAELMASGDIKGAIARLESINDLNPNFPQTHYNLGVAYYKDEQYEKSIESLQKAVSIDKNIADAYYTIGLAYSSIADGQIQKFEKPDKKEKEPAQNPENQTQAINEQKPLTKSEALLQIVANLTNSKSYFTQYADSIDNPEEKQKIVEEIENIDKEIKKYEEESSSSKK